MGEEGLKVPSGVPPHWRHGNKSADEVGPKTLDCKNLLLDGDVRERR
jgi:hypothetical protein